MSTAKADLVVVNRKIVPFAKDLATYNQLQVFQKVETEYYSLAYKFKDTVEPEIGKSLNAVEEYSNEDNESIPMENDYTAFKDFLMSK